jgi:hypothetical protein
MKLFRKFSVSPAFIAVVFVTGVTYAINGKQYIVYATGGEYVPSELIALSLP